MQFRFSLSLFFVFFPHKINAQLLLLPPQEFLTLRSQHLCTCQPLRSHSQSRLRSLPLGTGCTFGRQGEEVSLPVSKKISRGKEKRQPSGSLSLWATDAASVVNKPCKLLCGSVCGSFFLCKALNTKVPSEKQQRALIRPHYACMEKQTNKKISNASSFTHPPKPALSRSLSPFLHFFLPSLGPLSLPRHLPLVQPVVETFFFFPSSLYDLPEGGKERGGLEGSSHSKLERKGLRRVTAPRGTPPPVKAVRRPGERRAAAAVARIGAAGPAGQRRGSAGAPRLATEEAKGQAACICLLLVQGYCS